MPYKYKIVIAKYGQSDEKLTELGWESRRAYRLFHKCWVVCYRKWINYWIK